MVVLNYHHFSVAVNVTFITTFLFTPVSLVIRRGGERGALWFGCPSHQVLCPCSRQFSVFLLTYFLFSSTQAFCCTAGRVVQREKEAAYFHCMHPASVNTFCWSLHITKACCLLLQSVTEFVTSSRKCDCKYEFRCNHKRNRSFCIPFYTNAEI